jgi:hypothetical protein
LAAASQALQDCNAADFRKHKIEHDKIVLAGFGKFCAFLAIMSEIDCISRTFLECNCDIFSQPAFIFNDEKAHGLF